MRWIALFVVAIFGVACRPQGRYHQGHGQSARTNSLRDFSSHQEKLLVKVKLHMGEAQIVNAPHYTFTQNGRSRKGGGDLKLVEEGLFQSQGPFVFKSRHYAGFLESKRENGQWLYINHVPINEYLASVVSHEMSPTWPLEALKAQAVVSRTYLLTKIQTREKRSFDVDTTTNYQVYGGIKKGDERVRQAVADTHNEALFFESDLAQTFFHASCGGTLASAKEVWGKDYPYLEARASNYCENAPVYKWQVKIPLKEIARKMALGSLRRVAVAERSESKRVKTLAFSTGHGVQKIKAEKFRTMLGAMKVKSTFFGVQQSGDTVILTGRGFGHGVGMCQWGARQLAENQRYDYRRILQHHFPRTQLKSMSAAKV